MSSERTELDALRTYMTALLREQGVEAMEAWPREERPKLTGVVAAVRRLLGVPGGGAGPGHRHVAGALRPAAGGGLRPGPLRPR